MATDNPYLDQLAGFDPSNMPGGSLADYAGSYNSPPFQNLGYTSQPNQVSQLQKALDPIGIDFLGRKIGKFFGKDKKPKTPYWQRLANREWAQGNAALAAQEALYPRTLALQRRQAADYGDLYRRAANEALAHNLRTASATRSADLADYARLAPQYYQATREFDPQATAVRDSLFGVLQREAAGVDDPMSSAAAREIAQSSYADQASRGFGPSARQAALGYISRGLTGEQLWQQRHSQLFNEALPFLQSNQQAFGDVFQAVTGRPSMPAPQGANIMAPTTGIAADDLLSYGINREQEGREIRAARAAGNKAFAGQIIGGALGIAGKAFMA